MIEIKKSGLKPKDIQPGDIVVASWDEGVAKVTTEFVARREPKSVSGRYVAVGVDEGDEVTMPFEANVSVTRMIPVPEIGAIGHATVKVDGSKRGWDVGQRSGRAVIVQGRDCVHVRFLEWDNSFDNPSTGRAQTYKVMELLEFVEEERHLPLPEAMRQIEEILNRTSGRYLTPNEAIRELNKLMEKEKQG